jgi:hypothetical protein
MSFSAIIQTAQKFLWLQGMRKVRFIASPDP